jgi:hypothetical protein
LWSRQPAGTSEDLIARNRDLFRVPSETGERDHSFSDVEAVDSLAKCRHAPGDLESRRKRPTSVAPGGGIKTKPRYAIGEVYASRSHVDHHHAGAWRGPSRMDHLESTKTSGMEDRNLPHRIGLSPRPCKQKLSFGRRILWRSISPPGTKPRQLGFSARSSTPMTPVKRRVRARCPGMPELAATKRPMGVRRLAFIRSLVKPDYRAGYRP